MRSFEIMYDDLNSDAQARFLEFNGVENEDELNSTLAPLSIINLEETNCAKNE